MKKKRESRNILKQLSESDCLRFLQRNYGVDNVEPVVEQSNGERDFKITKSNRKWAVECTVVTDEDLQGLVAELKKNKANIKIKGSRHKNLWMVSTRGRFRLKSDLTDLGGLLFLAEEMEIEVLTWPVFSGRFAVEMMKKDNCLFYAETMNRLDISSAMKTGVNSPQGILITTIGEVVEVSEEYLSEVLPAAIEDAVRRKELDDQRQKDRKKRLCPSSKKKEAIITKELFIWLHDTRQDVGSVFFECGVSKSIPSPANVPKGLKVWIAARKANELRIASFSKRGGWSHQEIFEIE